MEYPSLDKPKAGALRFNTDSSQMEIYTDGDQWISFVANADLPGAGRLVTAAGQAPSGPAGTNVIEYVQINTIGNAIDFGDLTVARDWCTGSASNGIRGLWMGGSGSPQKTIIDYVTISTTGNAQDFGDLNDGRSSCGGLANSIRGVYGLSLIHI